MGFSTAIFRIRSRRFPGKRGLPVGLDFQREKSRNPLQCQRNSVSAFRFTSASRQGEHSLQGDHHPLGGIVGASWFDLRLLEQRQLFPKERFSAARAPWEHAAREASRTRWTTTKDNGRKQPATARKADEPDMNAQDRTLQNVYRVNLNADDVLRTTALASTTQFTRLSCRKSR